MQKHFKTKAISYFSRWTRKSYAIFNSLDKVVKISRLSIAITALALPGVILAQEDTTQHKVSEYNLDEVEIVDSEILKAFAVPSNVITVVGRQELQKEPIESVQDVLNYLSQIDLRQRGNNDVQADVSIRGGTFDQVLIMLNGINITNPQTGHHNLDLPISFDQIERVEILNGTSSQSFGANAYSGAINIITRSSSNNQIGIKAVIGDFGLYSLGASANIAGKGHRHFVAINRDASSGYTNNTDFERSSLYYNGKYILTKSFFEWQLSAAQKEFGAQSFYTAKYPNQFEETQSVLASLKYQSYGKISTKSHIYWHLHSDRFELFRDYYEAPSWYKNHNYHLTTVMGGNSRAIYKSSLGKTMLSLDIRHEQISSNLLGIPTNDTLDALFNPDGFYTKQDSRTNSIVSLSHMVNWGPVGITAALTLNTNTAYDILGIYPGLDFTYRFRRNWKINASINKTMRLPTFTDLYYAGPANIGNPDLLPEEAVNFDFGLEFRKGIVNGSLTSFNTLGDNSIDWVRKADTLKWQPMNITQVETYGIDAMLKFNLGKLRHNRFFIRNVSLQYTFITKGATADNYESRYVMDYLRHKLVLGINHRIYKNIAASWKLRYQERNGNYMLWDANAKADILTPYGAYTLVDLRVYWRLKNWMIFTDLKNLFDVQYIDYGNVLQPGRWFSVGVKKNFTFKKKLDVKLLEAIM